MNNTRYRSAIAILILLTLLVACTREPSVGPSTPASPTPVNAPTAGQTGATATQTVGLPTADQSPAAPTTVPTSGVPAAALVNGKPIFLQDYEAQVTLAMAYLKQQQGFDPNTEEGKAALVQLRRQVLEWMIDQALIEQAADREGVSIPEEKVTAEMARLVGDDAAKFEEWLKMNGLTRDGFQVQLQRDLLGAALQEHITGSASPGVEQVHARHILVMTEAEAMDVLIRLRSGGSFATLAQQLSQDKGSGDLGGDLGFFPRGVMPIEIEAVAFSLAPGQISGIVKTSFGYHIIEVLEKDPSRNVPDEMLAAWRQKTFLNWLDSQRSAAKIERLTTE